MRDPRVLDWVDGDEARASRTRRKTVLFQTLERYVTNPHTRGNIMGQLHAACELIATDAYEAGLRDGERPVRDTLEARGLPVTADLATLVSHERANAKLAGTFDALRQTPQSVCPFDCDNCHGDECPCERLGCAGYSPRAWIHGTHLGREHISVREHLIEDHGDDPDVVKLWSDAQVHGAHDGSHNTTWAYAVDLPHEKIEKTEKRDETTASE